MLLSSYHRRLRMISEALELRVEGARVSNCWSMGVVTHGYGGLGGGRYLGGGLYACGTKRWRSVACWEMLEHFPSAR